MTAGRVWASREFRAAGAPGDATLFHCALCGARFTHGDRACPVCPMARGCDLVRCPSCGYQFPRRSLLADAWRRLWGRRSKR